MEEWLVSICNHNRVLSTDEGLKDVEPWPKVLEHAEVTQELPGVVLPLSLFVRGNQFQSYVEYRL